MNKTSIEWCDYSVNPVRFRPTSRFEPDNPLRLVTMCQKVSPGCENCYAATIVRRFWPKDANANPFPGYTAQGVAAGDFELDEKTLMSVLKHKKPARVFWGDMTDLFGDWVKDEWLDRIFAVCALTPHLTHMFLTKRPVRMLEYMVSRVKSIRYWESAARTLGWTLQFEGFDGKTHGLCRFPLPNVLLGTSVENQKAADDRLDYLCELGSQGWQTMVSFEPLLGPVDPGPWWLSLGNRTWGIVGGESGPGARPMDTVWVSSFIEQCKASSVPCFVKQLGTAPYQSRADEDAPNVFIPPYEFHLKDRKGGDWDEWPEELRVRQFPEVKSAH